MDPNKGGRGSRLGTPGAGVTGLEFRPPDLGQHRSRGHADRFPLHGRRGVLRLATEREAAGLDHRLATHAVAVRVDRGLDRRGLARRARACRALELETPRFRALRSRAHPRDRKFRSCCASLLVRRKRVGLSAVKGPQKLDLRRGGNPRQAVVVDPLGCRHKFCSAMTRFQVGGPLGFAPKSCRMRRTSPA
jgi:hypothetical protein